MIGSEAHSTPMIGCLRQHIHTALMTTFHVNMAKSLLVSWEFNVPFQHKYGYIRDKMSGAESYPYPVKEGK